MATTRLDILVQQGARYQRSVTAKNSDGTVMNLTGYSARMQIRPTVASNTILLEASTANGRITIPTPANGIVIIDIGADVTAPLNWTVACYDLEIFTVDPANVIRLIEGYASLSKEVTR